MIELQNRVSNSMKNEGGVFVDPRIFRIRVVYTSHHFPHAFLQQISLKVNFATPPLGKRNALLKTQYGKEWSSKVSGTGFFRFVPLHVFCEPISTGAEAT